MRKAIMAGLLAMILMYAVPAKADSTYTYTGNPFTTLSGADSCVSGVGECGITGSFTVSTPLAANLDLATQIYPTSFSFTDGVNTLTNTSSFFYVITDSSANIVGWNIVMDSSSPAPYGTYLSTCSLPTGSGYGWGCPLNPGEAFTGGDFSSGLILNNNWAANANQPGTWSVSSVPEPNTLVLLCIGLVGILGVVALKGTKQFDVVE